MTQAVVSPIRSLDKGIAPLSPLHHGTPDVQMLWFLARGVASAVLRVILWLELSRYKPIALKTSTDFPLYRNCETWVAPHSVHGSQLGYRLAVLLRDVLRDGIMPKCAQWLSTMQFCHLIH